MLRSQIFKHHPSSENLRTPCTSNIRSELDKISDNQTRFLSTYLTGQLREKVHKEMLRKTNYYKQASDLRYTAPSSKTIILQFTRERMHNEKLSLFTLQCTVKVRSSRSPIADVDGNKKPFKSASFFLLNKMSKRKSRFDQEKTISEFMKRNNFFPLFQTSNLGDFIPKVRTNKKCQYKSINIFRCIEKLLNYSVKISTMK